MINIETIIARNNQRYGVTHYPVKLWSSSVVNSALLSSASNGHLFDAPNDTSRKLLHQLSEYGKSYCSMSLALDLSHFNSEAIYLGYSIKRYIALAKMCESNRFCKKLLFSICKRFYLNNFVEITFKNKEFAPSQLDHIKDLKLTIGMLATATSKIMSDFNNSVVVDATKVNSLITKSIGRASVSDDVIIDLENKLLFEPLLVKSVQEICEFWESSLAILHYIEVQKAEQLRKFNNLHDLLAQVFLMDFVNFSSCASDFVTNIDSSISEISLLNYLNNICSDIIEINESILDAENTISKHFCELSSQVDDRLMPFVVNKATKVSIETMLDDQREHDEMIKNMTKGNKIDKI